MYRLLKLTFLVLTFALNTQAQTITIEDIQGYLSGPKQAIESSVKSFNEFDQSARQADLSTIRLNIQRLKIETKKLKEKLETTEPLQGESWYLPKAKAFATKLYDATYNSFPDIVLKLEQSGATKELNDEYQVIVDGLNASMKQVTWGENQLMAKFLYGPTAVDFCRASLLLVEDAKKGFPGLNAGPIEGEAKKFKVSDVPAGALSGQIYINSSENEVAKFIMYQAEDKAEAYNAFNNMVYYLLACDHKDMEVSDDIIPLEKINSQYSLYPSIVYRPKDYKTPFLIRLKMQDTKVVGKEVWEVYVEYNHLNPRD